MNSTFGMTNKEYEQYIRELEAEKVLLQVKLRGPKGPSGSRTETVAVHAVRGPQTETRREVTPKAIPSGVIVPGHLRTPVTQSVHAKRAHITSGTLQEGQGAQHAPLL